MGSGDLEVLLVIGWGAEEGTTRPGESPEREGGVRRERAPPKCQEVAQQLKAGSSAGRLSPKALAESLQGLKPAGASK